MEKSLDCLEDVKGSHLANASTNRKIGTGNENE